MLLLIYIKIKPCTGVSKPLNIIVEKNLNIRLVEFGLAKGNQFFKRSLKTCGKIIKNETVDYFPPEIAKQKKKILS